MTLTTHGVAGSVIGAVASSNLAFAAVAAFASHFLFDTIPHWDYKLASSKKAANHLNDDIKVGGKDFIIDLAKIGLDFSLGLIIPLVLFHSASPQVILGALIGALCAMLPDPLQFVYMKLRVEPLVSLQKFHLFMHAKSDFNDRPLPGVSMQIGFIILFAILSRLII